MKRTRTSEMVGNRYGLLFVKGVAPRKNGRSAVLCVCDCGSEKVVFSHNLKAGKTVSCGCRYREYLSQTKPGPRKHGFAGHPQKKRPAEYGVWCGMRKRCDNPKDVSYTYYGGRGITYSDRWESFENFAADMGPRPSRLHTLEA